MTGFIVFTPSEVRSVLQQEAPHSARLDWRKWLRLKCPICQGFSWRRRPHSRCAEDLANIKAVCAEVIQDTRHVSDEVVGEPFGQLSFFVRHSYLVKCRKIDESQLLLAGWGHLIEQWYQTANLDSFIALKVNLERMIDWFNLLGVDCDLRRHYERLYYGLDLWRRVRIGEELVLPGTPQGDTTVRNYDLSPEDPLIWRLTAVQRYGPTDSTLLWHVVGLLSSIVTLFSSWISWLVWGGLAGALWSDRTVPYQGDLVLTAKGLGHVGNHICLLDFSEMRLVRWGKNDIRISLSDRKSVRLVPRSADLAWLQGVVTCLQKRAARKQEAL